MVEWAQNRGITLDYIQPGNPQQNAYIERYNRTVRYDWLNHLLGEDIEQCAGFCHRVDVALQSRTS